MQNQDKNVTADNFTYQDYVNLKAAFLEKQTLMEEKMWIDASIAKFNDELQQNYGKSVDDFCKTVLDYLAKLTNAYRGSFYILEKDFIESKAGYGCKPDIKIAFGIGAVGQSVESREMIFFKSIAPNSIVLEQNGAFQVSASSMVVLPLIFNQTVYGAIELLYVFNLSQKFIDFFSRITTNIAALLESIFNNLNTHLLLEESIKSSQILQAAEEELRQNLEELEATQQQMLSSQQQLEQKNYLIDALLESSQDGILIVNSELELLLFNKSCYKMLALENDVLEIGKNCQILDFIDKESVFRGLKGENVYLEMEKTLENTVFIQVQYYPIFSDDDIIVACGIIFKDVTADKERENKLIADNRRMVSNESVLKKAFEKQKQTQRELEEAHQKQVVIEEELRQSAEELAAQRDAISDSFSQLETQAARINDSIRYAERMQKSILPSADKFAELFNDFGIIYKPKDVVSGDFYWLLKHENYIFVAVVDCTGHGVPGAFMSMIGNTLLNEIIFGNNIGETGEILYELNNRVRSALKQEISDSDDGMDIAICRLNQMSDESYEMAFSGAKLDCIYLQSGEINLFKGDRISLGGRRITNKEDFTTHRINLKSGDKIFMMTDGLADMANTNRKRFSTKRVIEAIQNHIDDKASVVLKKLEMEMNHFVIDGEQRDDITMVGLELF